jgi:non-LEE-encoded effector NleA
MPLEACDRYDLSRRGFLATVRSHGFTQALAEIITPMMVPGAAGKLALDATGLFNVSQLAADLPTDIAGVSGKYGIQINLVKPDICTGQYY